MVGQAIDIHRLNMEELLGVVSIYPWYAGARVELCSRLAAAGTLSEGEISQAALYVGSRSILHAMLRSSKESNYADADVSRLVSGLVQTPPEPEEEPKEEPREAARSIFVVGGDYFTSSQYKAVRREDDNIYSGFATSEREIEPEQMQEGLDLCTETLAQIYAEQGYTDEAKQIYSKLILLYPEKSVYFASLIEKLDNN